MDKKYFISLTRSILEKFKDPSFRHTYFWNKLEFKLSDSKSYTAQIFTRAGQDLTISWDEFLIAHSSKHRSKWRLLLNKTGERYIQYSASNMTDDPMAWLEQFTKLEHAGWKGKIKHRLPLSRPPMHITRMLSEKVWVRID